MAYLSRAQQRILQENGQLKSQHQQFLQDIIDILQQENRAEQKLLQIAYLINKQPEDHLPVFWEKQDDKATGQFLPDNKKEQN